MENDQPAADAFESMNFESIAQPYLFMAVAAGLCALFMAVTFLQSGFNKLGQYGENKAYFVSQVEQTFLKHFAGIIWPLIVLLELLSGIISLAGVVLVFINGSMDLIGLGCILSALTLICLLFGQRVAKDYAGAASLTGYFIIAVIGVIGYAWGGAF
ncbi:MAG TPA: DoxX family protein [Bacteroidia bacterium]|nr:DoxX family protein [Bacteroidia bacterium]